METVTEFFNKIASVFSTFSVSDALDIILVALIIFAFVRIIRETRAMQLVKGIILLAVVYFIVNLLQMETSSYLFQTVFSNILIILVILFTPELRNILEQLGTGATRKSVGKMLKSGNAVSIAEINEMIEAFVKACSDMSDNKTGALIVFEKEMMLGNIIKTGIVMEAKATKELIENVFYPKTPLHDGAMVVRGAQIYAAGCILPLTHNEIDSALGTRHRAGIGLSEESDAVVVIVSEETGAISVAKGGNLEHDISDGKLRDILTTELLGGDSSADDSFFKKLARRVKK